MTTKLTNKIREFRTKGNITQEELAFHIGVTRKTVNTVENNVFVPSVILAIKIARYFEVKVEEVFEVREEWS